MPNAVPFGGGIPGKLKGCPDPNVAKDHPGERAGPQRNTAAACCEAARMGPGLISSHSVGRQAGCLITSLLFVLALGESTPAVLCVVPSKRAGLCAARWELGMEAAGCRVLGHGFGLCVLHVGSQSPEESEVGVEDGF